MRAAEPLCEKVVGTRRPKWSRLLARRLMMAFPNDYTRVAEQSRKGRAWIPTPS